MNVTEFRTTLKAAAPPVGIHPLLTALWYEANGNWDKAHEIAQEVLSGEGSMVHAYLHRREGDIFNAEYWYRRAGLKMPECTMEEEWSNMVEKFLSS